MKQIIKKVLSIYMISTLVLSMLLSSLQRVSADESENIPNSPIKVLEENISDQSLYIKYYMTIDNQKFLYIENSKIVNGDWVTNTLKTKVDENNNSCFQKTRTMQAKLDVLKPISGIREVFAHFIVECVYKKDNYNICFDYLSGKVKAEIKEQDLRNILLQYLEKNMRGEVSVEFCTDYLNDEESVDIYIYDGCQRAIIEVKFSLPEKYYAGSTHYSITARTGDGIKQLDKYARHLAKDGRLVDFGYVYMFYMSDVKKETLMSRIDNKTNELLRGLSDELNSIFDGVEMNDMKCWGTAS